MHIGVDFGTTRTIVATVDRGNYPVVTFTDSAGDAHEYVPSVAALRDGELVYGFEAIAAAEDGAAVLRSFKRALAAPTVTLKSTVRVGSDEVLLIDVLTGFLHSVKAGITEALDDPTPTCVVAVPAHAHGAQRLLTLEAFRRAGFAVTAMVNEPSAAGFEYTHRQGRTLNSRRSRVLVYDLGGGTFDASLVSADGTSHEVVGSLGVNRLGGDDFDEALARCALRAAGRGLDSLDDHAYATLLDECRAAKEHLSPQARRIAVDVAGTPVTIAVADFYAEAQPLVAQSLDAMAPLVGGLTPEGLEEAEVAGIYLVGGASGLPLVPRLLRERFGRRVHRSPYPAASTAIGLAIAADPDAGYTLTDRLSRGFGVFREGDSGESVHFDPLVDRDEVVSLTRDAVVMRRYRPVHTTGWFRFVEYSALDEHGQPRGDIAPFADVVFPFAPGLQGKSAEELRGMPVEHLADGPEVEEKYVIDPHGIIDVHITDLETGYSMTTSLRGA